MTGAEAPRPLLRVVRGEPTAEELAALTVVLTARVAAAAAPTPTPPRSEWRNRAPLARRPLHPGRDAWRASARPH